MKHGSWPLGLLIGILTFAILLFLELMPHIGPPGGAISGDGPSHHAVFGMQFGALPAWVKVWMKFQDIIIGASLFFVLWRREA